MGQQCADVRRLDRAARGWRDVTAFRFPIVVERANAGGFDIVESGGALMWRPFEREHSEMGNLKIFENPCLTVSAFHPDCDETVFPGKKV
jgi:hypothetical protein